MSGRLDDDGIQFAASGHRLVDFPAEWGTPPGARFSEERARWVIDNVNRMETDPLRRLKRAQVRQLNHLRKMHVDRLADESAGLAAKAAE